MRLARIAATVVVVLALLAACRLPTVADETVDRLEGPHVTIVSREVMPNPSDQWNYTYVMLEVSGEDPRLSRILSMLVDKGWAIHERSLPILAYFTVPGEDRPETQLTLATLGSVLENHRYDEVGERFSNVPTHDDRTYYVAILTPLTRPG
jgi:hypothetical protein